ncbi:mitochondrial carrier protein-like protein [Xylogone sp. PMI_703]|nr:mitochondrial carrier protein-like protein [Xylogone sp. PMI_703]
MTDNHARLSPALVETIAGLTAGSVSTLAVHPLDVIKTRLQIHRSVTRTPINSLQVLRTLTTNGHAIQNLYRGLTPNLLGNATSWSLFFSFKSIAEKQIAIFHSQSLGHRQLLGGDIEDARISRANLLSPLDYFAASGIAGLLVTFATNPIWVLKTRMLSSDKGSAGAYASMWHGARQIWHADGVRGFYRGVGISCLGVSHGAVQFGVYDPLKNLWRKYLFRHGHVRDEKLSNSATLAISSTAKIVAGTVTYPYQVIRSRLQTYDAEERFGRGISGVVSRVWQEEGFKGFYRGVGASVLKVLPATWVTFLVYENMKFYLPVLI